MTVVYLVSLHLGVPCPHLSQLNLFTVTALETPWCYSEPWGFALHAHIALGPAELCQPHGAPHPSMVPGTAQGCWASSPYAGFCYSLLHYTCAQKKSPFIHPQIFCLLPRPTPPFTPRLHHYSFHSLNQLHRLVLILLWPLSPPAFPSGTFLVAQSHQDTFAHTHLLAKKHMSE